MPHLLENRQRRAGKMANKWAPGESLRGGRELEKRQNGGKESNQCGFLWLSAFFSFRRPGAHISLAAPPSNHHLLLLFSNSLFPVHYSYTGACTFQLRPMSSVTHRQTSQHRQPSTANPPPRGFNLLPLKRHTPFNWENRVSTAF